MGSLINWVDAKPQVAPIIADVVKTKKVTSYFEPFAGGLSVFDGLYPCADKYHLGDINRNLIAFYYRVANEPDELYSYYVNHMINFNTYDEIQELHETFSSLVVFSFKQSARFWYLNNNNQSIPDRDKLYSWSNKLKSALLYDADYKTTLQSVDSNSFVYLDPPHWGDGTFNYLELFEFVQTLPCPWVMSVTDHPLIQDMFPNQQLITVTNSPVRVLLIIKNETTT